MITYSGSGSASSSGQIDRRLLAGIAILVLLVAGVGVYLLFDKPEPEPVPVPAVEPTRVLETVAPAESKEERGDSAREVIAELRENQAGIDYAQAYTRAREFQAAGNFADAQLLYFFAARGGHGQAAFELASLQDPNHFSAEAGLMDKPDPFQAYKWYNVAREAGDQMAIARLTELRTWAEAAAAANDPDAEQLLLQWE
ncbi:MAG: hypothetical protein QNK19_09095 [Xanthomonadales bacterium]|nr:hypothetical protein [Xanthomonadales bacterium]